MNDSMSVSSPYAHSGSQVNSVMLLVCVALLPATVFGLFLYGWPAINLFAITCLSALLAETLCLLWLKQPWWRILDGSALLTGWLIAITLPPWAPWWIGVTGSAFAIIVGKHLYGGLGCNIFNPAMLARTALLITFPVQMTSWSAPAPLFSEGGAGFADALSITFSSSSFDGISGATHLGMVKTALTQQQTVSSALENGYTIWHALIGISAGSMGEGSELLLLLGGLLLLRWRVISWEIPVSLLATVALTTLIANQANSEMYAPPSFHLLSGGLLLGAFFIATDPVTSPISRFGKLLFGTGCGIVIFVIRTWGGFPEAVAFAILFMNGLTPLIDRYCKPRVYGRLANGEPQPLPSQVELSRKVGGQK